MSYLFLRKQDFFFEIFYFIFVLSFQIEAQNAAHRKYFLDRSGEGRKKNQNPINTYQMHTNK